jgi:ABC-type sugar transport system substrate-binding protein
VTKAHRILAAGMCVIATGGLAACGSSDDNGSSTSASTSTGGAATTEAKDFTYGYSMPTGQNPWMNAVADATEAAAAPGKMERTDAQLDPGKAVEQVNRFITDGDPVIAVGPAQVPESLQGSLKKAADQGTKVLALEWSFSDDATAPPTAPVQGQASMDRGQLGKDVAAAAMDGAGGDAKIVYIGLPFPVSSLDFFEKTMKASLTGGSSIIANLDNPTDNAQGALKPLSGALAAHPETNAIVTYNGPSALAAVQAVKSAGMTDKVKIYDIQIDGAVAPAVKSGAITEVWDLNPPALGEALGGLIKAAGEGAPDSEWKKTVLVKAPAYTKDTIDTWQDWSKG